jgi:hypothetical protein
MNVTARAFWVTGPSSAEIRDESLPLVGRGEVLVRALHGAVSRGTETLVFRGGVPESEHERMRCPHQAGAFPAPVKYGYSSVGRVLDGPPELQDRSVFCLYPHQTAYVVPAGAVVPVPEDVPLARAVLAANMETALNALWDARPLAGDRVSVVGAGVVGSLCAYLARRVTDDVELLDVRAERSVVASAFGVRFAAPEAGSIDRDLVLHASGSADGLRTALRLAGTEGLVLELSWFGDAEVSLPLGGAFHARRLTLRSSQVGTLSPHARRRFTLRSRLELALSLCRDPRLDVLFSGEGAFEDLPQTMAWLAASEGSALCHRVRYP